MNTKILERLGAKLKELRKTKGLTQEELAAIVQVHATYIGKLEAGKCNLSIKLLFKLSRALDVTLYEVFSFDKR